MQNLAGSSIRNMQEKLENAAPYNLFFSSIPELPQTVSQENSITFTGKKKDGDSFKICFAEYSFTDLLCPTLGKLKSSLQINFLVEFKWLMEQYDAKNAG